jgi:hypothetical protein
VMSTMLPGEKMALNIFEPRWVLLGCTMAGTSPWAVEALWLATCSQSAPRSCCRRRGRALQESIRKERPTSHAHMSGLCICNPRPPFPVLLCPHRSSSLLTLCPPSTSRPHPSPNRLDPTSSVFHPQPINISTLPPNYPDQVPVDGAALHGGLPPAGHGTGGGRVEQAGQHGAPSGRGRGCVSARSICSRFGVFVGRQPVRQARQGAGLLSGAGLLHLSTLACCCGQKAKAAIRPVWAWPCAQAYLGPFAHHKSCTHSSSCRTLQISFGILPSSIKTTPSLALPARLPSRPGGARPLPRPHRL